MRQVLRVVVVNFGVFLGLYFAILLLVSVGGDIVSLAKRALADGDRRGRHELALYADTERAKRIFEDQAATVEAYAPFIGWRRLPMRRETLHIGTDGLRRHQAGRDNNAADAVSLGFFGNSTMWGTGVDDDGTIAAHFDALTTGFSVVNYAEGAWTSRQSLAQLINLLNRNQAPEWVVFYGGANDAEIGCNLGFGEALNSTHEAPRIARTLRESGHWSYLYRNFAVPALDSFRRVSGRDGFETRRVCEEDPARAEAVAESLVRNWEMARLLVESNGGRFFAFLQVVAGTGAADTSHLSLDEERLAQYRAVYEIVREKLKRRGRGWAFDLSGALDGEPPYLIDHAHLIAAGNAIIARRIREALEAAAGG